MEGRMNDPVQSFTQLQRTYLVPAILVLALLATMACSSTAYPRVTGDMAHVAHAAPDASGTLPVVPSRQVDAVSPAVNVQIAIENFQFSPQTLTIPVGTTVIWTNHDKDEHTVTSSTRLFS